MADNTCYDNSPLGVFHMEGAYAIPQGADWDTTIYYKENGSIVDFATTPGYSARLQVRKDYGQAVIVELSSTAGTIILATGAGNTPNIVLKWTPAATSPITQYTGIYDLEIYTPSGTVLKFLEGRWELRREVTV